MRPTKPVVTVQNDNGDRIMAHSGWIVAYAPSFIDWHRHEVVWCFGFLPGTAQATKFGVSVQHLLWVRAFHTGEVIETFSGDELSLPESFKEVFLRSIRLF